MFLLEIQLHWFFIADVRLCIYMTFILLSSRFSPLWVNFSVGKLPHHKSHVNFCKSSQKWWLDSKKSAHPHCHRWKIKTLCSKSQQIILKLNWIENAPKLNGLQWLRTHSIVTTMAGAILFPCSFRR